MKIRTKFNVGETIYFRYKDEIISREILKITIVSDHHDTNILYSYSTVAESWFIDGSIGERWVSDCPNSVPDFMATFP